MKVLLHIEDDHVRHNAEEDLLVSASVAGSSWEHFRKHCDAEMPYLKATLVNANDKSNCTFWTKSTECISPLFPLHLQGSIRVLWHCFFSHFIFAWKHGRQACATYGPSWSLSPEFSLPMHYWPMKMEDKLSKCNTDCAYLLGFSSRLQGNDESWVSTQWGYKAQPTGRLALVKWDLSRSNLYTLQHLPLDGHIKASSEPIILTKSLLRTHKRDQHPSYPLSSIISISMLLPFLTCSPSFMSFLPHLAATFNLFSL